MKHFALIILISSLSACSFFGVRTAEEPGYTVLAKEGDYEIRSYKEMLLAKVLLDEGLEDPRSVGFRRLFKYISGENSTSKKISMTAPVLEDPKATSQKIPMTAPVFIADDSRSMAFILPEDFNLETAPIPNDASVNIEKQLSRKVAVLRFSGVLTDESIEKRSGELRNWVKSRKLKSVPILTVAGYDPPWTIPRLRRNEIHITLEP